RVLPHRRTSSRRSRTQRARRRTRPRARRWMRARRLRLRARTCAFADQPPSILGARPQKRNEEPSRAGDRLVTKESRMRSVGSVLLAIVIASCSAPPAQDGGGRAEVAAGSDDPADLAWAQPAVD